MSISVLVLTYNEETNLRGCLESVLWSGDIHVVDSGSTDATVAIARELGAHVHVHPFEHFSAQRNWALDNVPLRYEWLLVIDADERASPELATEIQAAVRTAAPDVSGFLLPLRLLFLGRWIPHASQYREVWFLRLFRHRTVRYEDRLVNAHPILRGDYRTLKSPLIHDNRKGITDLVAKFNRYASLEAEETLRLRRGDAATGLPARLGGSALERRRWLKHLHMRLPFRSLSKFLYLYVWRRGFLDGAPGFFYCALMGLQEFFVVAKVGASKRHLPVG